MARAVPNLDWLPVVQAQLNADSAYRRLGSVDMRLGLAIGTTATIVTFEAFEIAGIDTVAAEDLRDADVIIEMSPRDWNAYLRKRKKGSGPSLLSLDLDTPGGVLKSGDPVKRIKFERYNLSLQAFLDAGAAAS